MPARTHRSAGRHTAQAEQFHRMRVALPTLLMMYVPAGYFTPPAVNESSATSTVPGETFHGRTAERQSPR